MLQFLFAIVITLLPAPQAADPATQFREAVALQQQGQYNEAAAAYRALLKRNPAYVEAQANLGVVLARLGKYDEAVIAYERALKLAPQLIQIELNLGIAHYRAGQIAKAVLVFERFLAQQPQNTQARQLYGLALNTLGRDAEAIPQLQQTLDAAPPDAAVLYALGQSCLRAGKAGFQDVLQRLAAFPAGPAGLAALHFLQGQAFLRDHELEQALDELLKAKELQPDLPRLWFTLGLVYQQLVRHQEALAAFEKELLRSPQDVPTLYYLAAEAEAAGNLTLATQRVNAALKLDPTSAEANGLLAKILFAQNKPRLALAPLNRALARQPNDPAHRYLRARLYQTLGRTAEANREFAEVQRLKAEQLKSDREKTPK